MTLTSWDKEILVFKSINNQTSNANVNAYTDQNANAKVIRDLDKREHFMVITDNFC